MLIKKIAVRFGHTILINGKNTSASGIRREYELIREYAPLAIKYLEQQGYSVLNVTPLDRSYDNEISDINKGIKDANEWKADLFLSCHVNAFDLVSANGCEVLFTRGNSNMEILATNICKEISSLGFYNRGAKADVRNLNEFRKTNMNTLIVEPFFCTSPKDIALYNADKLARAIVKGVTGKTVVINDVIVTAAPKVLDKVNYALEWQKFYNLETLTLSPLTLDGVYGKNTQSSLDALLGYVRQGKKYKYCLEFQKWFNLIVRPSKKLTEDGYWGSLTELAYQKTNELCKV